MWGYGEYVYKKGKSSMKKTLISVFALLVTMILLQPLVGVRAHASEASANEAPVQIIDTDFDRALEAIMNDYVAWNNRKSIVLESRDAYLEPYIGKTLVWCQEDGEPRVVRIISDMADVCLYLDGDSRALSAGVGYALHCLELFGIEEEILTGTMDGTFFEKDASGEDPDNEVLALAQKDGEDWYDLASLRPANKKEIDTWRREYATLLYLEFAPEEMQDTTKEPLWVLTPIRLGRYGTPEQNTDVLNYLYWANSSGFPQYMHANSHQEEFHLPDFPAGLYIISDDENKAYNILVRSNDVELLVAFSGVEREKIEKTLGWYLAEIMGMNNPTAGLVIGETVVDGGDGSAYVNGRDGTWDAQSLLNAFFVDEDSDLAGDPMMGALEGLKMVPRK